jgi:hypothetical protein
MRGISLPNSPDDEKNYTISSGTIDMSIEQYPYHLRKNWKTSIKMSG